MKKSDNFFKEFFSVKTDKEKGLVGIHRALGVGAWDMFNSGSSGLIGSWLLYFLTSFGGINPAVAALLISVRLFVDMIWAPVVAVISDNFYNFALGKKFGRRRIFLIFCIPTAIAFALMWVPLAAINKDFQSWGWIYYLVAMIIFDISLDLILIPWDTLPAEMTEDFTQRNKMGTVRMWAAGLAQPLIAMVPTFFMNIIPLSAAEKSQGITASPWALFATGSTWAVMCVVLTFFVFISSWDPILISEERRQAILDNLSEKRKELKSPLRIIGENFTNLALTLRIKTFRKHLILYFSTFGVIDSYMSIFVIFASIAFLPILTIDPSVAGVILGIPLLIMTFIWSPIGAWLFNHPKIGPSKLYIVGFSTAVFACAVYGFTYFTRDSHSATTIWFLIVIAHCIFTIGRQLIGGVPWVVFPMMADIDEIISRDKRAGIYAGAMTFVRKFTNAVFNIFIGIVLGWAGYSQTVSQAASKINALVNEKHIQVKEAYQSVIGSNYNLSHQIDKAGLGVALLMVVFVGALLIWALWTSITFKLNSRTHHILIKEIKRLRKVDLKEVGAIEEAKSKVDQETKFVVEELTGLDYDEYVWSGNLVKNKK